LKTLASIGVGVLLVLAGCGSSGGGAADAIAGEVSAETVEAGGDAAPEKDAGWDAGQDAALEEQVGAEALTVPWMPPPYPDPVLDQPYLQELNHTSNQVEPGIGPLVAVLVPPAGVAGFELPTQVTPRGFVVHPPGAKPGPLLVGIPEGDPDLVTAAFGGTALYLASPTMLYVVADQTQVPTPVLLPQGLVVNGLLPAPQGVYLLAEQGLGYAEAAGDGQLLTQGPALRAGVLAGDRLLAATDDAVLSFYLGGDAPPSQPEWSFGVGDGLAVAPVRALVPDVTLPVEADLVIVGENGLQAINLPQPGGVTQVLDVPEFAVDRVPLQGNRRGIRLDDGGFVVAGAGGVMRFMQREGLAEWRTYNQYRWLPSEDVRDLASEGGELGRLWFATAGGLATVVTQRMTLEEKLGPFVERIATRHNREGAVADSHLTTPGDLSTNIPWDSDNDGSWTSYWLLGECFRWKVTGAPEAKEHFDQSLEAMLRLHTLTEDEGVDWFLARAVIRKSTCVMDDCDDPDDGHWYTSPADPDFWVKRDTSNDEVNAHLFMMGHAYDLCADEPQKERIRHHVAAIVGGIMDNGWKLIDPVTMEETTYGQWDPWYVDVHPAGYFGDGGLRALQIMSGLTLAHYLTGEQRFQDAKDGLILEHQYHEKAMTEATRPAMPGHQDNDEMATNAFFVLNRYEADPALKAMWLEGWRLLWKNLGLQQGALWDLVNVQVGGDDPDVTRAMRWLRRAPTDMIRWDVHNSHRHDLVLAPKPYKELGSMRTDGHIIPYDERRCDRWNTSQFMVDGGMGAAIEMDGADVLMPYWMARWYGWITAE
jgi:hypothetical protein